MERARRVTPAPVTLTMTDRWMQPTSLFSAKPSGGDRGDQCRQFKR
jgi:hypothetical protein